MSFTRYNYDDCRIIKQLQESTGPGKYILNTPGHGSHPYFIDDPSIRVQKWGANNRHVIGGNLIDIDNDLRNSGQILRKYDTCEKKSNLKSYKKSYPTYKKSFTEQTRTTHPAFEYRDLEQNHRYPLFLNPQENTCMHFHNNLNTRLLERDNYKPKIPVLPNTN